MDLRLGQKYAELLKAAETFMGYPCSAEFSYEELYRFLSMPLNNVGDPWGTSNYKLNTHEFECEVVSYFANLYSDEINYWGYINNGGSEGNLCGLNMARQCYPEGIVYFSKHSHYSVPKAVQLTRSKFCEVEVDQTGEINYENLFNLISQNLNSPVIIMANIGTTMTGAIDNIHEIKLGLKKLNIKNFYIHCDGALHGLMLPYTQSPKKFTLSEVHSVSISGHKFIGSPIPCGVFLTHKNMIDSQKNYIEYIHAHDCTITGSRNAITPLMLWSVLIGKGYADWKHWVSKCLDNTNYAVQELNKIGIKAWANPDSNIVIFPTPSEKLVRRWQLACYEGVAHIVIMRHVNQGLIDLFVREMDQEL